MMKDRFALTADSIETLAQGCCRSVAGGPSFSSVIAHTLGWAISVMLVEATSSQGVSQEAGCGLRS